ncbi:MAG TPA: 23S rRNA (guanosine(2251)-2'-O)-methyltransferase RlmB [Candidatus Dormibacteraeota bacterium]|nr:23S rRNA (guanosine(2251)-2'-O)-methyltransferase RlmB [Candidatus Dormibacteraeota bacterium]
MPEILYGRNPVLEALRAGRRIRRLLLAPGLGSDGRLGEIRERAQSAGVAEETTARGRLNDVAHTEHHQGVAAYFDGRQLASGDLLRRLLDRPGSPWAPIFLCLDEVQDPQNLGSLARSSEALGVSALVMPRHRTAPLSAATAKASAGAIEHLQLIRVVNLVQTLRELRELDVLVVGLDAAGERRCDQVDLRGPVALVVGAEGEGLRPLTRRHCDHLVAIPMGGRVQSLNVAVAGALLMYEVGRQRLFSYPKQAPEAG